MTTYASHRCPMCHGVSHPASGCVYSPTFIVCGPCTRRFWAWLLPFMNSKGRRKGPAFYDHAAPLTPQTPPDVPAR